MRALLLPLLLVATALLAEQDERACIDWLQRWQLELPAQFAGCAEEGDGAALYRVAAGQAEALEALLIRQFGMAPLEFRGSDWEPARPGYRRTADGEHRIVLHSTPTLANRREDWERLDFHLRISALPPS
ncbi:hypothetical protein ACIGFL_23530 [Pseudomonas sp. NPDC077649]|uniref:hypothetical protein n=1 Tax=Pseudomonas sp. NPDC077649 TaxID=3364423 RepID=UPI0037CCB824